MKWVISWFDKKTEEHVGDYEVDCQLNIGELRNIFDLSENDPMCDVYPIENDLSVCYFDGKISMKLNLKNYSYFLECCQ